MYQDICIEVCRVARQAGAFIAHERKNFTPDKIEYKGQQDMVSYVDKQTEVMIVEQLRLILPEANIIGEENTTVSAPHSTSALTWIIDPLDGTTNFVHGMPPYCVSIALQKDDKIIVGVVFEITQQECFYAWQGAPAMVNGQQIKVSQVDKLENALVIIGLAYNMSEKQKCQFVEHFDYFNRHTHGARRLGSAATDLVYIAAGRAEGFYQANLSPWDVAAGAFIVQQAGGTVTDFKGGEDYIFGRQIVASNGLLHDKFMEIITL